MKKYLITDPLYYGNSVFEFKEKLISVLEKNSVDMACFRDKESANYKELASIFVQVCKEFNIKNILLNEHYTLAKELKATGVHLTSLQFDKIKEAKALGLYVIISCHKFNQIEKAREKHVHAITYSPIFETPNKGEPKGISKLKEACNLYDMDIYALGGIISKNQIKIIQETKAIGFASIRYFI